MSTRCQITVVQEEAGWDEKITMYHHCDGYPEHIIEDLMTTYTGLMVRKEYAPGLFASSEWQAGRAGKVAAYLCATHPAGFEPEAGHDLHGDILFHYTLYLKNHKGGCMDDKPTWEVEIRELGGGLERRLEGMVVTTKRTPLEKLAQEYCKKQKAKAYDRMDDPKKPFR